MNIIAAKNFNPSTLDGDVVVMFSTSRCGPCRMLQPVLDSLASEALGVSATKVLLDEGGEGLLSEFGIVMFPTLAFLRNGKQISRSLIGLRSRADIKAWIMEAKSHED